VGLPLRRVRRRDARLSKEQREAEEAEAKLREAVESRDALRAQAADLAARLETFTGAEDELARARAAKQELLIASGAPLGAELAGITAELEAAGGEGSALDEAIGAGERAREALEQFAAVLRSARNWGRADLVTDSFLFSWAKRNKLDEARGLAGAAQAELVAFQSVLVPAGLSLDATVEHVALHVSFFDVWLDNMFSDLAAQDRIIEAQRAAADA
jgi:hypothetical protein